jgi:NAD(P)-dependent dehydrogenase (short-subunit alcohol dehydrogenase family)
MGAPGQCHNHAGGWTAIGLDDPAVRPAMPRNHLRVCTARLCASALEPDLPLAVAENTKSELQTAVVVGGSGGFGRGIVQALAAKSMRVVAVARDAGRLEAVAKEAGVEYMTGDATEETTAAWILQERQPDLVVLCAGARPLLRPIHLHTWETFALNWEVDTKATFVWLRNALLLPMKPGSHIIIVSSAAAIHGSVLSGGYAGAKRTQWFMAKYALLEAERNKLGLRIQCLLPMLSPTGIGQAAINAYAERAGVSPAEFAKRFGKPLTPAIIGQAVVDMHYNPGQWNQVAYQIAGDGLTPVS